MAVSGGAVDWGHLSSGVNCDAPCIGWHFQAAQGRATGDAWGGGLRVPRTPDVGAPCALMHAAKQLATTPGSSFVGSSIIIPYASTSAARILGQLGLRWPSTICCSICFARCCCTIAYTCMYTRTVYLFPSALQALHIKADVKRPLLSEPLPRESNAALPIAPATWRKCLSLNHPR